MIDVKKLVTGFLVLAVAASATALLISTVGSQIHNNLAIISPPTPIPTGDMPVTGNAFLPQSPNDITSDDVAVAFGFDSTSTDPTLATSTNAATNLSSLLAETYLNNLAAINPSGPQADSNGNPLLTQPDTSAVLRQIRNMESNSTSTLNTIDVPDWDIEAAKIPVVTISNFSTSTIANYTGAIQDAFDHNFVETNLETMISGNTDPSAAAYVASKIQSALADIAGIQAPAPAATFQKSLIKLLVYQKNLAALIQADSADPMKTELVLQVEINKYNQVVGNYKTQFQKLSEQDGFAPIAQGVPPSNPLVAFIDNALGIHTAHALFGLGDITFDPAVFGQMLIDYAKDIALQLVKNFIIHEMQGTVLKWVRGNNGAPKFIQQWGTTLVNAYMQTAIGALNSQMSCVGGAPFAAQLKLTLGATYQTSNNLCAVQFQNQLAGNNLKNFYNRFENGGWLTFGQTLQPDNNYYGSVFFTAQAIDNTAQNAKNAAQAKAVGGQGWKTTAMCSDGRDADTGCKPNDALDPADEMCVPHGGGPKYSPKDGDGDGSCANGEEPSDVQPGQVVGQVFNSSLDSSGNLVTSANSIAGLLDAFLSSLLNSIAENLVTAGQGAIDSLGSSNTGGPGGNSQGGSIPISCNGVVTSNNPDIVHFTGSGGQAVTLGGAGVNISNSPQYTWAVPGGDPDNGIGGDFQTIFNASGTYTATITDPNTQDAINGVQPSTTCTVTVP